MGFFDFLKTKMPKERILKKYYSKYPEQPYIDDNRDFAKWEELVTFDPKKIVRKEMMERNSDGLLPGHIYQLYWIDKYKPDKQVPVYFEYEFGINFVKEKAFLEEKGLLKNHTLTKSGKAILEKYHHIVEDKNNRSTLPKLNLKKELAKFDREQKKLIGLGIEPYEDRNEKIGFVFQNNAIVDYQNKDFESAKKGFLIAMNEYNFYTPGGVDYLAKIYRKEKDYQSEIDFIEKAIKKFKSETQVNWSKSKVASLEKRLEKAKALKSK